MKTVEEWDTILLDRGRDVEKDDISEIQADARADLVEKLDRYAVDHASICYQCGSACPPCIEPPAFNEERRKMWQQSEYKALAEMYNGMVFENSDKAGKIVALQAQNKVLVEALTWCAEHCSGWDRQQALDALRKVKGDA